MAKSSTQRQRAYHDRKRSAGLTKVSLYAPFGQAPAIRSMEQMFRQFNIDVVGIVVRNRENGQVKTVRF